MQDDAFLLSAVQANPRDWPTRLVYADWLEERGDVRAEFLRNHYQLATPSARRVPSAKLLARQRALHPRIDPAWLAAMRYRNFPLEITASNVHDEIVLCDTIALLRFWAPWSATCMRFSRVINRVAAEYAGMVAVGNVNVDLEQDLDIRFEIVNVPTTLIFARGRIVDHLPGERQDSWIHDAILNRFEQADSKQPLRR